MVRAIAGVLLASAAALAQSTFEVASVKPVAPEAGGRGMLAVMMDRMSDSQPRGWLPAEKGRLALKNWSLRRLIAAAYRARMSEVSGPAWLGDARYEIEATFPPGTPKEKLSEMLQALLVERFGLVVHREEREVPGYALVEAKGGAKLTPAEPEKPADTQPMDEEARREQMRKMQDQMQKRAQEMRKQQGSGEGPVNRNSWRGDRVTMEDVANWHR